MPSYNATLRTARLNEVVSAIDAGTGAGYIEVRTGSSPGIGSAASGTLLATLTLADPCATVSGDTLTFDFDPDIEDTSADASGTPGYCRVFDSDGNAIMDLTAGVGSGEVNFGAAITSGNPVRLTTGTITAGNQ